MADPGQLYAFKGKRVGNCKGCNQAVYALQNFTRTDQGHVWHRQCATEVLDYVSTITSAFLFMTRSFEQAAESITSGKINDARMVMQDAILAVQEFMQSEPIRKLQQDLEEHKDDEG